jgi:transcriptional regulator with XRE-family HTH domain
MISDETTYNRAFGRRVRDARKRRGLTQAKLADRVQLGRTALVMIERGEQRVPAHLLLNLAEVLDVDVVALLGVDTTPPAATAIPTVGSPTVNAWLRDTLTPRTARAEGASDGASKSSKSDKGGPGDSRA